ncbi:1-acyl-sn-glycerol-3-phosphate acyltransferase [Myxococcota bacterium]|nr:1-acyl-sn-glycerol-3-phosphate acyltransferase [Myxococcota bacterium]MBU1429525.1 1-acyl-sn-glycerol-3-phosphate acyltransferase [Myxococcota bacterium]MBU1899893.1 1-acyl-sn-glycerol-3-phosphate acyltransferase [Myxococcota bacterium]
MRREDRIKARSEVIGRVFNQISAASEGGGAPISEVINETLYHERERLRQRPSYGDLEADGAFYGQISKALPKASETARQDLLRRLLTRYFDEIAGHFNPRIFKATTRAIPVALSGLLNGLSPKRLITRPGEIPRIDQQLQIEGDVGHIARLHARGVVVYAPTHSSNLDSIIMGYALHASGLPPVSYGAGLNLFSNPLMGFFMSHLGAYTVDRLKTAPLYKAVLKGYATISMELGYDNLFFPGGTRSRSGVVEGQLKRGLLGATLRAYHNQLKAGSARPQVYVVPCTLNYPLVLEAATLIDDHLRRAAKARYIIVDDEFSRLRRWWDFSKGLFELDQRIRVVFGAPLDVFGDPINADGEALDPRGRIIDPARYLYRDGALVEDPARDAEYTRVLGERILSAWQRDTVILANHVAAFALFERLRAMQPQKDLYRFLRELSPALSLPIQEVEVAIDGLVERLKGRDVRLEPIVASGDGAAILRAALASLSTYHTRAVIARRGVRLHVNDANLLFYYRNRLDRYGLSEPLVRGARR